MKRVGIIGCGHIGGPVTQAIVDGQAGDCSLVAVMTRSERQVEGLVSVVEADAFFDNDFDLIIDAGGPASLAQHGARAMSIADLWTVNAAALANPELHNLLETVGRDSGHRLRVVAGAIAGLDGVATVSIAEDAAISITVDVAESSEGPKTLFKGSVREAALRFPDSVNVAVAAGLAGPGLDNVQIEVIQPGPGEGRSLGLIAESQYGRFEVRAIPRVIPDKNIHTVAACIIAALRKENKVIWVG